MTAGLNRQESAFLTYLQGFSHKRNIFSNWFENAISEKIHKIQLFGRKFTGENERQKKRAHARLYRYINIGGGVLAGRERNQESDITPAPPAKL